MAHHTPLSRLCLLICVALLAACGSQGGAGQPVDVALFESGPQYDGRYVDVAVSELGPQYDEKWVCLYGDIRTGFETAKIGHLVWLDSNHKLNERFLEPPGWVDKWDERFLERPGWVYGDTIACGLFQHSGGYQAGHGFGNMGMYEYRLIADIVATAPGESPYRGTLAYPGDCTWVYGDTRRDICYWGFSVAAGDAQPCGSIQNLEIRDSCYYQVARATHSTDVCTRIRPEATRVWGRDPFLLTDICIGQAVLRDSAPCDQVVDAVLRSECYYDVAYETGNPQLCAQVQRKEGIANRRGECYGDLAYKLDDLSLCEQPDEQDRDKCYQDYAAITRQYQYCDKVINPAMRESCPMFGKSLEK